MSRLPPLYRFLCLTVILGLLLVLMAGCWRDLNPPSDEEVIAAAKRFATLLRLAGRTADEILEQARVEAEKWEPKARLFLDTVRRELEQAPR
ncbi:MAG: hypothetical protein N2383_05630 [Caldilineales bacterium]|nr:hypothetical protein [Caldilineales bacterium]